MLIVAAGASLSVFCAQLMVIFFEWPATKWIVLGVAAIIFVGIVIALFKKCFNKWCAPVKDWFKKWCCFCIKTQEKPKN